MRNLIAAMAFIAIVGLIAWATRGELADARPQPVVHAVAQQEPRVHAVDTSKAKRPVISGKVPTIAEPGTRAPAASAQDPVAILKRASTAYTNMKSMRADFVQRRDNPLLGSSLTSRGKLYQRKPDRFLLQFTEPAGDVIVSDGRYFWLYYPSIDNKQVLRSPVSKEGAGAVDLQAQFIGDPVRRFQHKYERRERFNGRDTHVLTLTPRAKDAGYRTLKVWIDAADNLVRRFQITEQTGALVEFQLTNLTSNPTLSDDLFRFKPPAGARIVER